MQHPHFCIYMYFLESLVSKGVCFVLIFYIMGLASNMLINFNQVLLVYPVLFLMDDLHHCVLSENFV